MRGILIIHINGNEIGDGKLMIIAAYSGVGKSTFASMHPSNVVDFVCMPYKYFLDTEGKNNNELESCKANPDNAMRPDWPYNYILAIKKILDRFKIILIPSDSRVLNLLRAENIPYILVYPQRDAKYDYLKRFIGRGNTDIFISIFIGYWDNFLDALENDPCERRITLQPHQFLADVIDINIF